LLGSSRLHPPLCCVSLRWTGIWLSIVRSCVTMRQVTGWSEVAGAITSIQSFREQWQRRRCSCASTRRWAMAAAN